MKNKRGWFGESGRHAKAAKGIRTGRKHHVHVHRTKMYDRPMVGRFYEGSSTIGGWNWKGRPIRPRDRFEKHTIIEEFKEPGTDDSITLGEIKRTKGKELFTVDFGDSDTISGYSFNDRETAEKAYRDK